MVITIPELFDCPRIPGDARITHQGCRKMYQKANFTDPRPKGMDYLSICYCVGCEEGKSRGREVWMEKATVEEKAETPEPKDRLCKKCGATKHPGKFSKPYPDGRPRQTCKECEAQRQKKEYKKKAVGYLAKGEAKKCRTCRIVKPLSVFKYNRQTSDRLTKDCVACLSLHSKKIAVVGQLPKPDMEEPAASSEQRVESGGKEITIHFAQRDSGLFSDLESLAGMERRLVEQQILWILEKHFHSFGGGEEK